MNKIISELIDKFSRHEINKKQFFNELHLRTGLIFNEELCVEKLNEALDKNELNEIDLSVSISFIVGLTKKSVPVLCRLLLSHAHYNHEDIARLLQELRPTEAVECLYKAAELEFDYLSYDDTYQFARKCIKALSAIGNDDAIDKLKLLANSKVIEIAEYAKKNFVIKDCCN